MKDLFSLEGKTALVTGGGHGIGEMIARGLAGQGARVFVCSRNPGDGDDAITPISADLSRGDEILRLAREMSERADRLDILVNNSGVTWGAPIDEFPESGWDKVIDLNLKSPFFLTQALLPLIEKAASANDPGRIVNIGSVDGLHVGLFEAYSYAASKAGIHHLTRIMAKFLAPRHITVNAIAPGPFESKMMKPILDKMGDDMAGSVPLRRLGRPDDMAGAAVYLTSRAGAYVTGATLVVDGGLATTA
ncbi:MAG: SDR family oxidoreductase [Rhodobacteraceae bacterium]|nr:SDR family oxidoreductase [Paracoccaceae bacterium]